MPELPDDIGYLGINYSDEDIENSLQPIDSQVLEYEKTSSDHLNNIGIKEIEYLTESKKTILSPHIAGWTHESNLKIAKILLEKIISINHDNHS